MSFADIKALRSSILALVLALPFTGMGAPLVVENAGFEDISVGVVVNEFSFTPPAGWDLYDPDTITQNNGFGPSYFVGTLTPPPDPANPGFLVNYPDGAPEGQRVGVAFNRAANGGGGIFGLEQTLGVTLQPNTLYEVTVDVGNIASGTAISNEFFDLGGFPGYRIELTAGGDMVAEDDNSLAGLIPDGEFMETSFTFETGSDHLLFDLDLGIRLINLNEIDFTSPETADSDLEVNFDNVRVSATPIPEPTGSVVVLLAGSILFLRSRLLRGANVSGERRSLRRR